MIAATPKDISFVGYVLMRDCRGQSFWRLCRVYGIRDPYNSSNVNDVTRAGVRQYVEPFLDYVEEELTRALSAATTTSIIDRRLSALVEKSIAEHLPATSALIGQIASELSPSAPDIRWQNVGNSCREALKTAVREAVKTAEISLPPDVQVGNVKRTIELLAADHGSSDSRGTLSRLVAAVWDHAQTITHRDTTTNADATRLFVWTCLAIFELTTLTRRSQERSEE
ncbi:MAG: hypothetical protein ABR589_02375 [Chthoniobacterales bacterium]